MGFGIAYNYLCEVDEEMGLATLSLL